jgi:hypothetical protein
VNGSKGWKVVVMITVRKLQLAATRHVLLVDSQQRPRFGFRPVHMGFVVDRFIF